jgi:tubulin polyglutamylase TTLL6/13
MKHEDLNPDDHYVA